MTLTRFGFDTLGLNRIEIRSQADNERSMHLYEKLGFKPMGRMREATYTFGHFVDEALFDMLASEWRPRPPGGGVLPRPGPGPFRPGPPVPCGVGPPPTSGRRACRRAGARPARAS